MSTICRSCAAVARAGLVPDRRPAATSSWPGDASSPSLCTTKGAQVSG